MQLNTDKHAIRLSHLSVMQQQRALKNLARACRMRNKEKLLNAESAEANTYDWHRKVRLAREARAYNLIRGYLKGIPYKSIEQSNKKSTMTPYVVVNYCSAEMGWRGWEDHVAFEQWIEGGKGWFNREKES